MSIVDEECTCAKCSAQLEGAWFAYFNICLSRVTSLLRTVLGYLVLDFFLSATCSYFTSTVAAVVTAVTFYCLASGICLVPGGIFLFLRVSPLVVVGQSRRISCCSARGAKLWWGTCSFPAFRRFPYVILHIYLLYHSLLVLFQYPRLFYYIVFWRAWHLFSCVLVSANCKLASTTASCCCPAFRTPAFVVSSVAKFYFYFGHLVCACSAFSIS